MMVMKQGKRRTLSTSIRSRSAAVVAVSPLLVSKKCESIFVSSKWIRFFYDDYTSIYHLSVFDNRFWLSIVFDLVMSRKNNCIAVNRKLREKYEYHSSNNSDNSRISFVACFILLVDEAAAVLLSVIKQLMTLVAPHACLS